MADITDLQTDSTNAEISKWLTEQGARPTEDTIKAVRRVLADRADRMESRRRQSIAMGLDERRRILAEIEIETEEQARDKRLRDDLEGFLWILLAMQAAELQAEIRHRLDRRAGALATPAAHHWHRALVRYIASKVPDCIVPPDDDFPVRDAKRPVSAHLLDEHKILINGVTPDRAAEIFKQLLHDDSTGFLCRLRAEGMRGAVEILYPEDENDSSYIQRRRMATPSYSQILRDAKGAPVRDENLTRAFLRKNADVRLETLMRLEILHPEISRFSPSTPPLGLLPVRHQVAVDVDLDNLPPTGLDMDDDLQGLLPS